MMCLSVLLVVLKGTDQELSAMGSSKEPKGQPEGDARCRFTEQQA